MDLDLNYPTMNLNFSTAGLTQSGGANGTLGYYDPMDKVMSQEDVERMIREVYASESVDRFSRQTLMLLISLFVLFILFGATGNGFVCYVVARNRRMVTPRNIFIINLAISDLTLCLFTQPFNLMRVCTTRWPLGDFMCKFVPVFTGVNVFVSTISIASIALDRFQVVVFPTRSSVTKWRSFLALATIWLVAFLMASPLIAFNRIEPYEPIPGIILHHLCLENKLWLYEKAAYSIACMLFQYVVPIILISIAHWKICMRVKYRMVNQQMAPSSVPVSQCQSRRRKAEARRKRKTTILLLLIAVVFACAWLPLNIFNIFADMNHMKFNEFDRMGLVFPICHMLALLSACTNPVLYGWLNDNFRKEFLRVLRLSHCSRQIMEYTSTGGTEKTNTAAKKLKYDLQTSNINDSVISPLVNNQNQTTVTKAIDSSPSPSVKGSAASTFTIV